VPRVLAFAVLVVTVVATSAAAATRSSDSSIARAGVVVQTDFPAGFTAQGTSSSAADLIKSAKGVDGCAPYVSILKTSMPLPQGKSLWFGDGSRSVGNDVVVYASDRAAGAALALYARPSVVGCIESLAEKQVRQNPRLNASLDDVTARLDRQDIAGLGDDSVVYEGDVVVTKTDGSTTQIGVGTAAVRVGRAVDVVSYNTTGGDLTEILTPVIDASVTRLRTALARSA
jgi:hypothetical protein